MKAKWTVADIPNLNGRTVIVTGASGGIGYEIALRLAAHGAYVVLTSRDRGRTADAASRIKAALPAAQVEVEALDLARLASVKSFAEAFLARHSSLDILINNAGVAGGPRRITEDGFERHFQVNYLGHFALTGLLLPALLGAKEARVVTLSSDVASQGKIDFEDLQGARSYRFVAAYAQSKLANLLFAFELDRRSRAAGAGLRSFAVHPGVVRTSLLAGKDKEWGRSLRGMERVVRALQVLAGKPAVQGALPVLYQAAACSALSHEYLGPFKGGRPSATKIPPAASNPPAAGRLWELSAELTGVRYEALPGPKVQAA